MTPTVFINYPPGSEDSPDVRRFVDAVEQQVRQLSAGLPAGISSPEFVGGWSSADHVDGSGGTSFASASSETSEALDCAVLVALYSDAYFSDSGCLQTWSWFYERTRWFAQRSGRASVALVGVPWTTSPAHLPPVVLAAGPVLLPEPPAARGASAGPAVDRLEVPASSGSPWTLAPEARADSPAYRDAVGRLAELIVAGIASSPLPMAPSDAGYVAIQPALRAFAGRNSSPSSSPSSPSPSSPSSSLPPPRQPSSPFPSPFATPSTESGARAGRGSTSDVARPAGAAADRRRRRRAGGVGIVVAAVARDEQPAVRTRLEFYGDEPEAWAPFRPARDETAYELAEAALRASAIDDTVCYPATARLAEDFSLARTEGRVVVVMVDPWLAASEPHREVLSGIAGQASDDSLVAGTLVVFNPADDETMRSTHELQSKLSRFFVANRGGTVARFDEVRDADELAAELVPAVVRARNARVGRGTSTTPDGTARPAEFAGPSGETWVDLEIWSGRPLLPRYGDSGPES